MYSLCSLHICFSTPAVIAAIAAGGKSSLLKLGAQSGWRAKISLRWVQLWQ